MPNAALSAPDAVAFFCLIESVPVPDLAGIAFIAFCLSVTSCAIASAFALPLLPA